MSDTYLDLPSRIEDAFPEIESDITMDLMETNEEYAVLNDEISDWKKKHPFIDKVMEGSGEIHLTAEEHEALAKYLSMKFHAEDMERLHFYFRGHTDAVAYLKKIKALRQSRHGKSCSFAFSAYSISVSAYIMAVLYAANPAALLTFCI